MKVSTKWVAPILRSMYRKRGELVPCFIGASGIGKTDGVFALGEELGVNVVEFILSNTVPSEVSGIRMPDKDTKMMEVFDDARMASLKDGDILFFDEVLQAPDILRNACLTLIESRIMASGRKLPDVFIVAASNKVAAPGIIQASFRNRFQYIELEFDGPHWVKWFKRKYGADPTPILDFIQEDSDQYNILTPREVTKLYEWLKDGEDDGEEWKLKLLVVKSMFDSVICDRLVQIVRQHPSAQRQIADALRATNIDTSGMELDSFEDMSLKDIMEFLQAQPEWEAMSHVLSTIEFDEGEKNKDVEF